MDTIAESEATDLALESLTHRPVTVNVTPTYNWPIINRVSRSDMTEHIMEGAAVAQGPPQTRLNNLLLGVPVYTSSGKRRLDSGLISTTVDVDDSWGINCLLSQLPHFLRLIDKRLGVSSHFPPRGTMQLTPISPQPISNNRLEAIMRAVVSASGDRRYLLFDADHPRHSSDGHRLPKSWLWDVYDEIGRRLAGRAVGDDYDTRAPTSCVQVSSGRIFYGYNDNMESFDIRGNPVNLDLTSTDVTDEYVERIRVLLQQAYDEGWCHFESPPPNFEPMSEYLWRTIEPMYPSAVELYYNS